VITGHADATYGLTGATNATRQQITTLGAELQTQYPTLFHTELGWITGGDGMNERIPPFNDIRVRRALNYAVDRRTLADLNGEGPQAGVSCQVLPPRFPGYQPYCPYTTPPLDGSYHGPDLAKAKQLIAASPYKGMAVTAWNLDDPTWNAVGAYLVTVLKQLGFRANQQVLPNTPPNYLKVFGPPARTQFACCLGWGSDFPTPGNFFASAWLGCPANGNPFGYCNPDVDALVKQAQTADPVTANRLWAQIDRKVTDDAPWISEYVGRTFVLTSKQVGNYQSNLLSGPLWDQMWVK
jgi:peptide/nickel transport system substrate-binding protein